MRIDPWGDHLRFWCDPDGKQTLFCQLIFDGTVDGDTANGKIAVFEGDQINEYDFQARRDKADLTGTWNMQSVAKSHKVKLFIEKQKDQLIATYLDRDQATSVTDFYNFGGGFYFTLRVGFEKNSFEFTGKPEEAGWLIGHGVTDNGNPTGSILFYPYSMRRENKPPVILKWNSRTNPR